MTKGLFCSGLYFFCAQTVYALSKGNEKSFSAHIAHSLLSIFSSIVMSSFRFFSFQKPFFCWLGAKC